MKKLLFTAVAVAAFVATTGTTHTSAMSYHDNDIQFSRNLELVSYQIEDSCVTDGQDPKGDIAPGKFAKLDGKNYDQFMFHCGRSKSTKVGDWIKAHVTYEASIFSEANMSQFPGQANFATIGTMKVVFHGRDLTHYEFKNVLFAQYSSGFDNYWIVAQLGAKDLGRLTPQNAIKFYKSAMLYGDTYLNTVPSKLCVPLCGELDGSPYHFVDDAKVLQDNGYLPVEVTLNV